MIIGINKRLEHDGDAYDVQAEDGGLAAAAFDLRVFSGGELRWTKQVDYGDLIAEDLPQAEFETELRKRMEHAVRTIEAAILQGRIGEEST